MAQYHDSPVTGKMEKCSGKCKYGEQNVVHVDAANAKQAEEKFAAGKYGSGANTSKGQSKQQDALKAEAMKRVEAAEQNVETARIQQENAEKFIEINSRQMQIVDRMLDDPNSKDPAYQNEYMSFLVKRRDLEVENRELKFALAEHTKNVSLADKELTAKIKEAKNNGVDLKRFNKNQRAAKAANDRVVKYRDDISKMANDCFDRAEDLRNWQNEMTRNGRWNSPAFHAAVWGATSLQAHADMYSELEVEQDEKIRIYGERNKPSAKVIEERQSEVDKENEFITRLKRQGVPEDNEMVQRVKRERDFNLRRIEELQAKQSKKKS